VARDFFLFVVLRFLPEAVTDHLTLAGPVFLAASFLVMRLATLAGLQAGYGRFFFSEPERPHFLPVFTSRQSSLNHFVSPPLGLAITYMFHHAFCTS
jgi:hypothetical protein